MQSLVNAIVLLSAVTVMGLVKARTADEIAFQEELGALFLQPTHSAPNEQKADLPEFMKNAYSCMSSNHGNCPALYQHKEVNLIRSFFGTVNTSPSEAVRAYSAKVIKNSVEIKFNISLFNRQVEKVHYSMLRLYRRPLTKEQLRSVKEKCGGDHLTNVTLQLYSHSGSINSLQQYSLRAIQPLQVAGLGEESWVEFVNLTQMFASFVRNYQGSTSRQVKLRLAVQCSSISPSELGLVFDSAKHKPQLVEFTENDLQKEMILPTAMNVLARSQLQHDRSKRDTSTSEEAAPEQTTTATSPSNNSASVQAILEPLPTNYKSRSCNLYKYTISLENTDTVVSPAHYNANICAGLCYGRPTSNIKNHHAYLQSIAHRYYSDKVPSPCCVPKPGTLKSFSLLTSDGLVVTLRKLPDMIATECECL